MEEDVKHSLIILKDHVDKIYKTLNNKILALSKKIKRLESNGRTGL